MGKAYCPLIVNSGNEVRFAADQALAARCRKPMAKKIPLVADKGNFREALSSADGGGLACHRLDLSRR